MKTLKQNIAPLIAFLIAGSTAILAYDHLSYVIPFVVFKYPIAIVVLYAFFQLIAYAERRRSAQLDESGPASPLARWRIPRLPARTPARPRHRPEPFIAGIQHAPRPVVLGGRPHRILRP